VDFDYSSPDYTAVFNHRIERLQRIREQPHKLPMLYSYYREHPWQFINDWGNTYDPRNLAKGLPATIPFLLFKKQEEWIKFVFKNWKDSISALTEKSRGMGLSWLAVAFSATIAIFNDDVTISFVSRVESNVDKIGDPDSLFEKARMFIALLPPEFRGDWMAHRDSSHLKILFPATNSIIRGEAGKNAGRGGRASIVFVDEAAHLQQAESVEKSLSQTTFCRQDISTPNGRANPFARKRFSGALPVFTLHWRDDPHKNKEWYDKMCKVLNDPVIIAQELDIDYSASVNGIVIPSQWVQAAVGAYEKLGLKSSGPGKTAMDVADEGFDDNSISVRFGMELKYLETFSGKGSDIFKSVIRAYHICDNHSISLLRYDADGLGASVRGDSRMINEHRAAEGISEIISEPFRGSAQVVSPELKNGTGVKNKDRFQNLKSQSWWHLRTLFLNTYRAIVEKMEYDVENIISIDPRLPELSQLLVELSQPTYSLTNSGKIVIDKSPDGSKSPNRADSVMILYSPERSKGFFDV